jgi:hypothetical protein
MATYSSEQGGLKPEQSGLSKLDQGGPKTAPKAATTRRSNSRASSSRKATASRGATRSATTSTQPKSTVEQVQDLAERAVLVPVGASLLVGDNLGSTVKGLATRYGSLTGLERELKRYERRGATARSRFERRVKRTRTRFERRVRQRRSLVERTVRQNRRRFEREVRSVQREVRSVRKDLEKQSAMVGDRVEKLVSDAQGLIGSAS